MEAVLAICSLGGLALLFLGVIYSNVVVYLMAKDWNRSHAVDDRIPAWAAWGKGAIYYQPISKYRHKHGNGSLYRQLRFAYWMGGIGGASALVGLATGYILFGHSK
jgi:hypothetical protein